MARKLPDLPKGKFDGLQDFTDDLFTVEPGWVQPPSKPDPIRASGSGTDAAGHHVGVIGLGQHLTWREHTYTTYSGAQLPCRHSGIRLCVSPAQEIRHSTTPTPICPCTRGY